MAQARSARWSYLVLGSILWVGLIATIVALRPGVPLLRRFIQEAALIGYSFVFLTILSSAYLRQLVRFFGRPLTQFHHVVAVTGLVLLAVWR